MEPRMLEPKSSDFFYKKFLWKVKKSEVIREKKWRRKKREKE